MDLAGPAQVLTHAGLGAPRPRYIAASPRLQSAQGLELCQLEPLPESLPQRSWLLVIGGRRSADLLDGDAGRALVDWLARMRPELTACICSGTLLAARAGLLDGRSCTTHHQLLDELRRLAPRAQVLENRLFTRDGTLWTSAGIASGMDLCLQLVAEHWGYAAANAVAQELVLYHRRSGSDPQLDVRLQYRNHMNQRLHRVQDWILRNPGHPWTVSSLAEGAHLSARHLSRLFSEQLGVSLKTYLQRVRLAQAEQLLREGSRTVDQVAEAVGYGSARQLRRLWRQHHAESPASFRRHAEAERPFTIS